MRRASLPSQPCLLTRAPCRSAPDMQDQAAQLRSQYDDLNAQFIGSAPPSAATLTSPNDPSLSSDFAHAATHTPAQPPPSAASPEPLTGKSVRFRDDAEPPDPARAALFPYRDDPSALEAGTATGDQGNLSNQQIHSYHAQVLAEQDDQLDALGASIGRQRALGQQIGDELDEHVLMLDEVDGHVDRQQGRLGGARERIGKIARRANDNKQLTAIVVLIVILVLLIIVLKT